MFVQLRPAPHAITANKSILLASDRDCCPLACMLLSAGRAEDQECQGAEKHERQAAPRQHHAAAGPPWLRQVCLHAGPQWAPADRRRHPGACVRAGGQACLPLDVSPSFIWAAAASSAGCRLPVLSACLSPQPTLLSLLLASLSPCVVQVTGCIKYNGQEASQFVLRRTAAYVDQLDYHIPSLTVRGGVLEPRAVSWDVCAACARAVPARTDCRQAGRQVAVPDRAEELAAYLTAPMAGDPALAGAGAGNHSVCPPLHHEPGHSCPLPGRH